MTYSMDDVPFDIIDVPDIADMSDVTSNDVIEAAKRMTGEIKNAKAEAVTMQGDSTPSFWTLKLEVAIGPMGIDGNGKYKNKRVFPKMIVNHNPALKTSDWWSKRSYLVDFKALLSATGYDPKTPPKVNDAFCQALKGCQIMFDIKRVNKKTKVEGKYVKVPDDFENEITNFRKAQ